MRVIRQTENYRLYYEPLQRLYRVIDSEGSLSFWFNDTSEVKGLSDEAFDNYCGEMKFFPEKKE